MCKKGTKEAAKMWKNRYTNSFREDKKKWGDLR